MCITFMGKSGFPKKGTNSPRMCGVSRDSKISLGVLIIVTPILQIPISFMFTPLLLSDFIHQKTIQKLVNTILAHPSRICTNQLLSVYTFFCLSKLIYDKVYSVHTCRIKMNRYHTYMEGVVLALPMRALFKYIINSYD